MGSVRHAAPLVGLAVAAGSVAAITGANYGLREVVPAVSAGVVYLLAVLLVSELLGAVAGRAHRFAQHGRLQSLPPSAHRHVHAREGGELGGPERVLAAAVVTSTLAQAARARAEDAEQHRRETDLSAEMARRLLGGSSVKESMLAVGQRIAQALSLGSVSVEPTWADRDERRKALPLLVGGNRAGAVLVPNDPDLSVLDALQHRVVPALEGTSFVFQLPVPAGAPARGAPADRPVV